MQPQLFNRSYTAVDLTLKVLSDALKVYRQRWLVLVGIVALFWLPVLVLNIVILNRYGRPIVLGLEPFFFGIGADASKELETLLTTTDPQVFLLFFGWLLALNAFSSFVMRSVIEVPLVRVGAGAERLGDALRASPWHYIHLIGTGILQPLLILLFSILLFLPFFGLFFIVEDVDQKAWASVIAALLLLGGLILSGIVMFLVFLRCAMARQAVVLEGRNAWSALVRSWRMLHVWRPLFSAFGVFVCLSVPRLILVWLVPQMVLSGISPMLGDGGGQLMTAWLVSFTCGELIFMLLCPLETIGFTFLFRYLAQIDSQTAMASAPVTTQLAS